jgi:hypothetical protein
MSQLNTGPIRPRTRVSVITLFGLLFFGLALMAALPRGATEASQPLLCRYASYFRAFGGKIAAFQPIWP